MKRLTLVFVLVFLVMSVTSLSAKGEEIKFKGMVQTWFSYADQEADEGSGYGFTLRRVRLTPYGSLSKKIKWRLQAGWDKQSAKLIEVYLDFLLSKGFKIRVGQFTAPGTISSTLTSSAKLDLIERPMVTQQWNGINGLASYRGIGVQAHGDIMNEKLYYAFMIANPKTTSLFNPGVKSTAYSHDHNGVMLWGRLETKLTKGLRVGAFYGGGKETDTDYVRNTYGAHFFYVQKGITFKVEYIAGEYGPEDLETKYNGFYGVLGYRTGKWEPIVGYDAYTPNENGVDSAGVEKYNNISVGINYYHSKRIRFQANYVFRDEAMGTGLDKIKNNIFYICCQYTY